MMISFSQKIYKIRNNNLGYFMLFMSVVAFIACFIYLRFSS